MKTGKFGRRTLLRAAAASSMSAGLLPFRGARAATGEPTIQPSDQSVKRYTPLGRTGLVVSDISFGASRLKTGQEHLVNHALDRGINYFDTAESYTGGRSEQVIGRALKGKRDMVYLASKAFGSPGQQKESMMATLEESLRRLDTDYIDVYFNHAVNSVARMQNPEWHEFTALAKKQGKIRFTGISGHAGRLIESLDFVLDEDMVDVILVAYNFGQDPAFYEGLTRSFDMVAKQPDLPRVLAKAKSKNVGVVAMKTLMGARLNDMRPFEDGGATFAQAAFRWVLSNDQVDALIISMTSESLIDEYLGGSGGQALTHSERQLLERYASLNGTTYCKHACNDCEGACPYGVPIADVLRTRMYATDYQDVGFARAEYAQLPVNASACLSCTGQPCQNACTHGIPVAQFCAPTHRMLA
jgi:predicted aldo/keto reductase-like oxidoreductase